MGELCYTYISTTNRRMLAKENLKLNKYVIILMLLSERNY